MKALPDKSDKNDADSEDAPGGRRPAAELYSSQSESETTATAAVTVAAAADGPDAAAAWHEKEYRHRRRRHHHHHHHESQEDEDEEEEEEEDDEENNCGRRHKSKKKHKKHHKHDKKHKKHKKRVVEPIFLWAQNRESKIVRVVCEDYDPHNRLRLVKTGGVWTSNPRSRVQLTAAVAKSRSSSRYGDESQKETDDEQSTDDGPTGRPDDVDRDLVKAAAREQLAGAQDGEPVQLVDLNDNSIEFGDAVCSEEDEDEQRSRIDHALEMIERDPTLVAGDVNVPLATIETAGLRLPEGTTIHQVKTEDVHEPAAGGRPATASTVTTPPSPVRLSPAPTPVLPLQQCTFGELTIISQQDLEDQQLHLQNEPLNLEAACKRPGLEIRLQEQPFKKKRVERPPQQRLPPQQQQQQQQQHQQRQPQQRHQSQLQQQLQQQPRRSPLPPPPKSVPIGVKREWDPLSELKEVLSDPRLTVPDPLLVPKARLAALVASPATEIPKLLQQRPPSLLPPPDPDLLTVSLSHLQSILLQHADEQRGHGKLSGDGTHHHHHQSSSANIDQMLWLSYLSSCKDMAGVDADLISSVLNLLLPPAHGAAATGQQPYGGYATPQQAQWNDLYYAAGGLMAPAYGGGTSAAGYRKSEDFGASPLLPPPPPPPSSQQQQQQQQQPSQKHHQKSQLSPTAATKQRGVCPELQCCNGVSPLPPQPSTCYDMCCAKAGVCSNPFAVQLSPAGCGDGGGNLKAAVYTASDGAAAAGLASTCCFPTEMGCAYSCHQPSPPLPSPASRKHLHTPSQSSPARNRTPYSYQTGLGQHHQLLQQQLQTFPPDYGGIGEIVDGNAGGNVGANAAGENVGVEDPPQCFAPTSETRKTPPPPPPPSQPAETAAGGDATAAAASKPLQKAKIKVKQHLIDPNAKPKLLNIEGALHLAGANAHDLLTSPLWHPLFGSQEKRYGCRWQWTTPVTTSASTTSSDTSGTR